MLTCLDYQTLRNYIRIAKRFSLSRRRDTPSFARQAEGDAFAEPQRDFGLCEVEECRWPVKHSIASQLRISLTHHAQMPRAKAVRQRVRRQQSD